MMPLAMILPAMILPGMILPAEVPPGYITDAVVLFGFIINGILNYGAARKLDGKREQQKLSDDTRFDEAKKADGVRFDEAKKADREWKKEHELQAIVRDVAIAALQTMGASNDATVKGIQLQLSQINLELQFFRQSAINRVFDIHQKS